MAAVIPSLVSTALLLLLLVLSSAADAAPNLAFDSIYQFGDSISDTGNLKRETNVSFCSYSPYGETAFGKPTGRCSDGFLVIDFFAKAFNLPLLNPYLQRDANFTNGVNFAVAGATALDPSRFAFVPMKSCLSVQIEWFRTHLKSACSSSPSDCKNKLKRALFLVGEIGGNDYNYALFSGKTMQDVQKMVPDVIQTITDAVKEVIANGAVHIVVPGNFPIGCMPVYLNRFGSNDQTMYDDIGCLKPINELPMMHNEQLQNAIKELQEQNPGVNIYYGDNYAASTWVLQNAVSLGFDKDGLFNPCCGNAHRQCGLGKEVPLCPDPKKRISWDGTHPTQEAYRHVSEWLLSNIFTQATPSPTPAPAPTSTAHLISVDILRGVMASSLALWAIGSKLF